MENRLETLRDEIDKLPTQGNPDEIRMYSCRYQFRGRLMSCGDKQAFWVGTK